MPTPVKKPHIVVVEDDLDLQELIAAYFKPKGFTVSCFLNPTVALIEAPITGHDWDVLLSDMTFDDITAIEFTRQLKKHVPELPIILISENKEVENILDAMNSHGAFDVIVKPIIQPIQFSQLHIAVQQALQHKTLQSDLGTLRTIVKKGSGSSGQVIGKSAQFLAALDIAKRVAASRANIFITGESGTGKEVFAKYIHSESKQKKGPFVPINCTSIPENLLESELFGHTKGAFTGAIDKRIGLFEEAEDGTIFLDEIGDLSLSLQAKLLRVLQERTIKRVGENQYRPINCRIISATHKNLETEVREQRFREDLYFRLNVIPIALPPLRDRQEDIIPLAESFLRRFTIENASPARTLSKPAAKFLLGCCWRGNVRELENTIERAVALCTKNEIDLDDLLPLAPCLGDVSHSPNAVLEGSHVFKVNYMSTLPLLDDVIHQYIEYAVKQNDGARDKTARDLGIDRKTLYKRMRIEQQASGMANGDREAQRV